MTPVEKKTHQGSTDKVKSAFDRGVILKTLQSAWKFASADTNWSLFANMEAANSNTAYANYSNGGKNGLTNDGYSLAFKIYILGIDFAQPLFIGTDGARTVLDAMNKLIHLTSYEIKAGDDPLRKGMLSDIVDPLPLIINPILKGTAPTGDWSTPGIIKQEASSIENERNIIRLPQNVTENTKISFDFKLLTGSVGAALVDHLFIGKWTIEENSKRRNK